MSTLRARVTLAAAAATAAVMLPCGLAAVDAVADAKLETLDRRLERGFDRAIEYVFDNAVHGRQRTLDAGGAYGRVYADGLEKGVIAENDGPRSLPGAPDGFSFARAGGRRWRVYLQDSNVGGPRWGMPRVQLALPTTELDAAVARVRALVAAAGALATLLVAALVWWLSGTALAPMRRLVEEAEAPSGSEGPTLRLPFAKTAEVELLSDSLDRLIHRRQVALAQTRAALAATRTFTADAESELRAPLADLRANLDRLAAAGTQTAERERSLRDALVAHARLTSLIDGLQMLARGDAGAGDRTQRLDLAELADAAVIDARRRHPGVAYELVAEPLAPVTGDPDGLRVLLETLIGHAAQSGAQRVRVGVRSGDRYLRLTVDDDGPGIPDAEKARAFDRFGPDGTAAAGNGSGLELAIAAQQAELHGGRLKLDDSSLGGARFELLLGVPPDARGSHAAQRDEAVPR